MAATKLSILLLFRRIFVQPIFRTCTTIVGIIIGLWWFGHFFADALICIPVQKNWIPDSPGHCGNKHLLFILPSIAGIGTDVMLLTMPMPMPMPMPMLKTLHVPRIQKVGLAGLFAWAACGSPLHIRSEIGLSSDMHSATVASCVRYRTLFFETEDATCTFLNERPARKNLCNIYLISRRHRSCDHLDRHRIERNNHQCLSHRIQTVLHQDLSAKAHQPDPRNFHQEVYFERRVRLEKILPRTVWPQSLPAFDR